MVTATLSAMSLLLTEEGWLRCDRAASELRMVGIDRHGKAAVQTVILQSRRSSEYSIFLGTSKCCGAFSPNSKVQDASGRSLELSDIAAMGFVGDLRFENVLHVEHIGLGATQSETLWNAMCSEAAAFDNARAAIRCRAGARSSPFEFGCVEEHGSRLYYKTSKSRVCENGMQWMSAVDELAEIFKNNDGVLEFDRSGGYLAMTLATSYSARQVAYEITYDALQHTSSIRIEPSNAAHGIGLGVARCAHVLVEEATEWDLIWDAPHWSPICNGFLLTAR